MIDFVVFANFKISNWNHTQTSLSWILSVENPVSVLTSSKNELNWEVCVVLAFFREVPTCCAPQLRGLLSCCMLRSAEGGARAVTEKAKQQVSTPRSLAEKIESSRFL